MLTGKLPYPGVQNLKGSSWIASSASLALAPITELPIASAESWTQSRTRRVSLLHSAVPPSPASQSSKGRIKEK